MSDESLRAAERIMASVQDAKRKEQANQALEQVKRFSDIDAPKPGLKPTPEEIVVYDSSCVQGELFPDAVRAAKHRLRQGS